MGQKLTGRRPNRGVVAVIQRDIRYLVIRRSQTVSAPGAFCFPGGGIEKGESESAALVRELAEELAITGSQPIRRVWTSRTPRGVELFWWIATIPRDAPLIANPDEVSEVHWWSIEQMIDCPALLTTNREFLAKIACGSITL